MPARYLRTILASKRLATGVALALLLLVALSRNWVSPALATPANDNFANAIAVTTPATSGIVATADTGGAGVEAGEPSCFLSGASVWYNWTSPAGTGTVVFDTFGSNFDTTLALYTGNSVNALTQVACNDDSAGGVGPSIAALSYTASTTYHIQLAGYSGSTGSAVLNISTGADMIVNTTSEANTSDNVLTLREAMLLARGGTGPSGVNRSLGGLEPALAVNSAAAGPAASDLIHFLPGIFPPGSPATITLTGALPDLSNSTGDDVSGIGAGVHVVGLNTSTDCFPVSGNNNVIEGFYVIGNCYSAVKITGNSNRVGGALSIERNTIETTVYAGVRITGALASNNVVQGNYIGTDPGGTYAVGNQTAIQIESEATGNIIGGSALGQRNLLSGNSFAGIYIINTGTSGNIIRGNWIGLDASGSGKIANTGFGIISDAGATANTVGGVNPGEGNVVSGSGQTGIQLSGGPTSYTIYGNKIGTDATGSFAVANGTYGVYITSGSSDLVGGIGSGQANVIAYNQTGVVVQGSAVHNPVRGNSIYGNTTMGIDDASGGNYELPAPSITTVAGKDIHGAACNNCTVDVYSDVGAQGRLYIGTTTANGSGLFTLSGATHPLPNLTAVALDGSGDTSEFSAAFAAPIDSDGDGIGDNVDQCPTQAEDFDGFQDGDGCPDPDNDQDGICDPGMTAASCTGSDQGYMCFDPAGTLSCPLTDCRNIAEDHDAFKDTDGCPEPDNDNDGFPDAQDQCPGTDSQTGPDGMLGSPQDLNHNGIKDPSEATLTTDDITLTFEDKDGVLDTDGCHDSPGEDFDGDGYSDDNEALHIGTDPGYPCGGAGWPSNVFDSGLSANKLDIQDVTSFVAPVRRLGTNQGDPNFSARYDLVPGRGILATDINLQDLTALIAGTTGFPPMFNGAKAFGHACPLPPP